MAEMACAVCFCAPLLENLIAEAEMSLVEERVYTVVVGFPVEVCSFGAGVNRMTSGNAVGDTQVGKAVRKTWVENSGELVLEQV